MKKLFKIWLITRVLTLITVVGAAQTDISSIDPVKKGNLCIAMLKNAHIDTVDAKNSKPVSVNGMQFSAVNYDEKTAHASPVSYTAQTGDQGMMTKDSIVWAVIHGKQQYLVTPKKISLAPVQNSGQQSSVDANAIMAYLQQKTDSLLQAQNQIVQQQANTISVLNQKVARLRRSGGNQNQGNQRFYTQTGSYSACFGGNGAISMNQPYPYRGYRPSK